MPNAFTPNKDGVNDVFSIKYPFAVRQLSMVNYNRFGKIFETSDIRHGWDGTYKDQLQPQGGYVWMISFTDRDGKKQNAKGTMLLLQ